MLCIFVKKKKKAEAPVALSAKTRGASWWAMNSRLRNLDYYLESL